VNPATHPPRLPECDAQMKRPSPMRHARAQAGRTSGRKARWRDGRERRERKRKGAECHHGTGPPQGNVQPQCALT
jgi:hypothetical protein